MTVRELETIADLEAESSLPEPFYTVEEFLNLDLPGDENNGDTIQYELVRGRIVGRPKKGLGLKHGRASSNLDHYLVGFVKANELGFVSTTTSTNLGRSVGSNYVEPDVCFVAKGRIPNDADGLIPVAPDLVVEVNSPSDTTLKIHTKIEEYLENGVRMVWSVYPLSLIILEYKLDEAKVRLYNLEDELEGGEVLLGFKLSLKEVFDWARHEPQR